MIEISFLLAAGSMTGLWIAAKRPVLGWSWLLGMECFWVWYSLASNQRGLAVLCVAYGIIYAVNLLKTRGVS